MNIEVPCVPLANDSFTFAKTDPPCSERELGQLILVQTGKERLAGEEFQIDLEPAAELSMADKFNLLGGKREPNSSPIKLVPNIRPNSINDIGINSPIHQPEFDFVLDGRFAEVDQEDLHRRITKYSGCARGGLEHRIFDLIRRDSMIHAEADARRHVSVTDSRD